MCDLDPVDRILLDLAAAQVVTAYAERKGHRCVVCLAEQAVEVAVRFGLPSEELLGHVVKAIRDSLPADRPSLADQVDHDPL
jgi:hypothetical protein